MWEIELTRKEKGLKFMGAQKTKLNALWCRSCMEAHDLLPSASLKEVENIKPPPTIEDIIQEMIEDALSNPI